MRKLSFALVGAGRMGTRWAAVLSNHPKTALAYIVDTGSGKAKELAKQYPNTSTVDLEAALNSKEVDAVLIATPHKHLSSITHAALSAGKHVLCEKPGAIKAKDIKKNLTLAEAKGLTYMVGYNHRFHDGFVKARQYYKKGEIGEIIFIRARYGFGGRPGYDKEWRLNKSVSGGGHLLDQGVHMIDLAKSFLGDVQKVSGFTSDTFWKHGIEDNGFVLLQSKSRNIASIHASLTQWEPLHNFEIYGTKGYLSVEGLGRKYGGGERLIVGKRPKNPGGDIEKKIIECNPNADDSLSLELDEFISAIGQDRSTVPSPAEAYETLKVVEDVYRSNRL